VALKLSAKSANKKKAFLAAYELNHGNISATCRAVGIDRQTYYNWREKFKSFDNACFDIEEGLLDLSEGKLRELVDDGNLGAICFHLKCKGKHRGWVERSEITGAEGRPLKVTLKSYAVQSDKS
jgi:transposase-like protein